MLARGSQVAGQGATTGPQYTGPVDVVRQLYKEGGLKSIFRGTGATLARTSDAILCLARARLMLTLPLIPVQGDGPGSAAYFVAYDVIKKQLTPAGSDPSKLNLGAIMLAGGSAGIAMWSIAIPPDVRLLSLLSQPQTHARLISVLLFAPLRLTDHQIPPAVRPARDVQRVH